MPRIECREVYIALDTHGCPNRCRHCWLGCAPNPRLTEDDLRWTAERFRGYVRPGGREPFIQKLFVMSWYREPDHSDDYERLHEVELELSDGPTRFELLSIRRLARDPGYADWAKSIGPDTCQITFFGLQETNDWFYRRKGAFQDCLAATERLLDAGMKPRWQLFLTRRIIPDLDGLMRLVDKMRIRERVTELGGEFVMFMHAPGPEGEGRKIYDLSATIDDVKMVPQEIAESTRKHFRREHIWETEAEVVDRFVNESDLPPVYDRPKNLCFLIKGNWDVFANHGTLEPWWRLGNLKSDPIQAIIDSYEADRALGYVVDYSVSHRELAERFGNPDSRFVVNPEGKWLAEYCEAVLRGELVPPTY